MGGVAEMLDGRLLGEGAGGAQIGDGERALHRQAFAHDFAKQPRHRLARQGAGVEALNTPQHFGLALGAIHHARAFQFADGARMPGPLVEQAQNSGIDFVNGIAVRQKRIMGRHGILSVKTVKKGWKKQALF